jgi:hypothetical protein
MRNLVKKCSPAPKAREVIAQGNALGSQSLKVKALKAREDEENDSAGDLHPFALSALKSLY